MTASLGTISLAGNLPRRLVSLSTVLERDHFYSDFLISQTTVSTNFNHLDDESKRPLDRNECPRASRATLVTRMFSMGVKLRGWLYFYTLSPYKERSLGSTFAIMISVSQMIV